MADPYAHLPETVTDPGMIQGRCSSCGKVLYERTTATKCHDAGLWMKCPWPEAYPWLDRDDVIEREREKAREGGLTGYS